MKKLSRKLNALLSNILHLGVYCFMLLLFLMFGFTLYVKIYTLDVSFLIDYLKQEQIIDKDAQVEKLSLEFERSFVLSAKNVKLENQFMNVSLKEADIEIAKTSLLTMHPAIKHMHIDKANLFINIDKINEFRQEEIAEGKKNRNTAFSIFKILKLTKGAEIADSEVTIQFNQQNQQLNNINIAFNKEDNSLNFITKGKYEVLNSIAPFELDLKIPNDSQRLDIRLNISDLKTQDLIASLLNNDSFSIKGKASVNIQGSLSQKNKLFDIYGSAKLEDGYVKINNLYNNDLDFKEITTDFSYNIESKNIEYNNAKLIDKQNNLFDIFGNFSFANEPTLNITAKTAKIDLMDAFKYIPDLGFKQWTDAHITQGDGSNVSFGFYGPLRPIFDGANGNPYFDIKADVKNLKMTYLDNLPAIENGVAKFTMFKKNIDIDVKSATTSKQEIKRGSVNISPLFDEQQPTSITIKSVSAGSIEDVLQVVNTKLNLNQDELFSKYSGKQETQATIKLNLNNFDNVKNIGTDEEKFITVDVIADIPEVVGVEPAFMQRFEATDSTLIITEEDFKLDASGFIAENPFAIILEEKLLEFGQHTKVELASNLDSYLLKEYLDIPSFNLSGLLDTNIKLEKVKNTWNFNVSSNIENSLINFGLLNYTKPYTQPGHVTAKGSFDTVKRVLALTNLKVDNKNFKAEGFSIINLKNIQDSNVNLKNIKINDKTDVSEFTLVDHLLTIKGKSLDLRPLTMKAPKSTNKEKSTAEHGTNEPRTIDRINIKLDKLYLNDDKGVVDASILLNLTDKVSGLIKLKDNKNAQSLYLKLTPIDDITVRVESLIPNVGNALRKSKLTDDINSGFGVLYGDLIYDEKGEFDFASLKLSIRKFQVLEAPLLAQVLASLSLEQLFTKKKGILFDELYTKFKYEDGIVDISRLKVKGPSLGLSVTGLYDTKTDAMDMQGTLVPVVKLNSVLGNIPVLGYILTGSQGAISGADFKVYSDKKGEKKVSVSPLSVITPGIVKDIFSSVGNLIPGLNNDGSKIIEKAREKANIESKGSK